MAKAEAGCGLAAFRGELWQHVPGHFVIVGLAKVFQQAFYTKAACFSKHLCQPASDVQ